MWLTLHVNIPALAMNRGTGFHHQPNGPAGPGLCSAFGVMAGKDVLLGLAWHQDPSSPLLYMRGLVPDPD